MTDKKIIIKEQTHTMANGHKYRNSQNDPEVARKIKRASQILMERNYLAYKELGNK